MSGAWHSRQNRFTAGTPAALTLPAKNGVPRRVKPGVPAEIGNPVAVLIPCHRVIRETGVLGGYRWGLARKQAMLLRELGGAAAD